jgi:hypothetical protein
MMNLFKFLKKKQVYSLETLLQKAAKESAYRAEFAKRILDEKLLIISNSNFGQERLVKLEVGMKVKVLCLKDGRVPVFTSPERIRDKGIFKREASFIEAKAKDIFELLKGATLILNPYSDYGKEFLPEEIERLLDGSYFKSRQIEIKEATQVLIGQPAKYPTEVVKSLIKVFSNRPEVMTAYVGWIHDPATEDPPHYIFAIDTNGDWRTISDEAGDAAQQILGYEEIVDFIQINHKGSFDDYFTRQTKPFYTKS